MVLLLYRTALFNPACLLHMEDKDQFLGLLDEFIVTYRPEHRDELNLLTEAVFAKWRQQRLWLAETNKFEVAIARPLSPGAR